MLLVGAGGEGAGLGGGEGAYCGWLECMTLLDLGRLSLTESCTYGLGR